MQGIRTRQCGHHSRTLRNPQGDIRRIGRLREPEPRGTGTQRPGRIVSVTLSLIKVGDDRLGGVESFSTPDGATAVYSSRARSLVDAVYDWSRFGSLPRAYGWIRDELGPGRVDARDIVNAAARFGNTSTRRRIGKLLEREGVNPAILMQLLGELPATSALIPWCPTRPKRGTVDRRWGVVFNG